MCWNENISLNTFVFSTMVMVFIYYNNEMTQYKTDTFKNKYMFFFFFSIVLMQLIEYFLWKSIKTGDVSANRLGSIAGWFVIRLIQPIAFLSVMKNVQYRNILIGTYLAVMLFIHYITHKEINFITTVKDGHLYWDWLYYKRPIIGIILTLFYFLFLIPVFKEAPILIAIALFYVAYFYIYKVNNWGSLWCWSINLACVYYVCNILIIQPFMEYNRLC